VKIYVAASWRTPRQPQVVNALRAQGHDVYDFRQPAPGNNGFHWSQVAPHWDREARLPAAEYIMTLSSHPRCSEGFLFDLNALEDADGLVLVMPAGRSAHLELGYAVGAGKKTAILLEDPIDGPDLMHLCADKLTKSVDEVLAFFGVPAEPAKWHCGGHWVRGSVGYCGHGPNCDNPKPDAPFGGAQHV
jgi:hypothetical protein